jgi:hypothetical protein
MFPTSTPDARPARRHYPKRYVFLEHSCLAREMDRLSAPRTLITACISVHPVSVVGVGVTSPTAVAAGFFSRGLRVEGQSSP